MRAELKLVPPKPGRSSNWYIRGSYLGTYVERSSKTSDRAKARRDLEKIKRDIERGRYTDASGPTFKGAASAYMTAGGECTFLPKILVKIGDVPITDVDQALIDRVASDVCPHVTNATRNREVYTPISAVLRHAGVTLALRRPKGAQGNQRRHWLRPDQVDAILDAAWTVHVRFAALLTLLLYCGCRLSEALRLRIEDVHLDQAFADVGVTKNGEPQRLHLPPVVVQAIRLALMQPGNATWTEQKLPRRSGSLFCLTKSGALYELWASVVVKSGVEMPTGVAFHLLRHTFGAWTRGAGVRLEETGRWTSRGGAKPYDHYEITNAGRVADRFPGAEGGASGLKEIG